MRRVSSWVLGLALWLGSCAEPVPRDPGQIPYEFLSDYGFFEGPLRDLAPTDGVWPYTVVSPLWADHAGKARFLVLPDGEQIGFDPGEVWAFPEGTIVIKNFFFDLDRRDPGGAARIIETRLLVKRAGPGWDPYTYVWNEDETEALYKRAGDRVQVDFTDQDGQPATQEYIVPNTDQCDSCHARNDVTHILGLVTHQVNFQGELGDGSTGNQLQWLADQGAFSGPVGDVSMLPRMFDPEGTAELDRRARSYLHANCSHCHRPGGGAGQAGLDFTFLTEEPPLPAKLGICKEPAAAGQGTGGRFYDVVPGAPEESIVIFRMESTDPEIKMPELPTRLSHAGGVALISEWIQALEPPGC